MPFATKFRAMMDMPFPGDTLGDLLVESVEVGHEGRGDGQYAYPLELILRGPGGVAGVKRAIKPLFATRCTTFSGYGTPYQLWFGRPTITKLENGLYRVTAEGGGARVHLEDDLARFYAYLVEQGEAEATAAEREAQVATYVDLYRDEVKRLVGRYRSRLRRYGERQP